MVNVKRMVEQRQFQVDFGYKDSNAHHVTLTGSFNDWDPEAIVMNCTDGEEFSCQLVLPPGNYEYKFVVDGKWLMDDGNPNFSSNDFGTLNSVLILE